MPIFTNTEWSCDHLILPFLLETDRKVDERTTKRNLTLPRTNVFAFNKIYQQKRVCAFSQDHRTLTISSAVKPVIFCHTIPSTVLQLNVVMFALAGQSTSLLMGDL